MNKVFRLFCIVKHFYKVDVKSITLDIGLSNKDVNDIAFNRVCVNCGKVAPQEINKLEYITASKIMFPIDDEDEFIEDQLPKGHMVSLAKEMEVWDKVKEPDIKYPEID